MQLAVKRHGLDQVAAVCFERGSKVMDVHATQLRHQPVGNARGDAAKHKIVDAPFSPSTDDVKALIQLLEEVGNVLRIMLKIAIHGDDVLAGSMVEAGSERGRLAEIAAQFHYDHPAVDGRDLFQEPKGIVTAAVIHEDKLER